MRGDKSKQKCIYKLTPETSQIVEQNLKLVTKVISDRFSVYGEYYEDMVQEGRIGLIKAACKHSADRAQFSTFAYMCIKNEIQKYVSECTDPIKVPVSVRLAMNALRIGNESEEEVNDEKQEKEILEHYQVSRSLIECGRVANSCLSLDATTDDGTSYRDVIADPSSASIYELFNDLEMFGDIHKWLNYNYPDDLLYNRIYMDYLRDSQNQENFLITKFSIACAELYKIPSSQVRNIVKHYPNRLKKYFKKIKN